MITFYATSSFLGRVKRLKKVRRGVYSSVEEDVKAAFSGQDIESVRANRDMILMVDQLLVIKLRLPDTSQRLSKKDGYRLIYLVSKISETVVFLDIYPKNGPEQQLSINSNALKLLIKEFIDESTSGTLSTYTI